MAVGFAHSKWRAAGLCLAACVALVGCDAPLGFPNASDRPSQTPTDVVQAAQGQNEAATPSAQSRTMGVYLAKVQSDLLLNDLLRTDNGSVDTPFTSHQLASNFDAIALNDEYTTIDGRFVARTTPSPLSRWDVPVRIGLEFGASVPFEQRDKDVATVKALIKRLAKAARHPISMSDRPNFHVLVLNEDERQAIGPRLEQIVPGIGQAAIDTVEDMPRSNYCVVFAFDPADNGAYRQAVAIIRGEHADLMRKSCLHEEITQGLGLANDTPRARPSIFNDDEEFALLTHHDELLLRILYDPRLQTGMSPEIARPISAQIARELMGESS